MNKSETILAGILVCILLCGVAWQNYRGAPNTAEIIIARQGGTPFDAKPTPASFVDEATHVPQSSHTEITQNDPAIIFLNQAAKRRIQQLPGVGEVLAQRILDYRDSIGTFVRLEQLMEVNGIGAAKMEEIEAYLKTLKLEPTKTPTALFKPPQVPFEYPVSNVRPQNKRMSLNKATLQQLQEVSGIGPQLAKAILLERQRRKGFQSWADVDAVTNVGPSRIQALKERFTLP
jgi:competence ComEA-like helix-hairpin-helix protein